jgi:hypothetical protein
MKLCLWLLGAAAVLTAASGTVEGTVCNSISGSPVRKALVTLRATSEYAGYQALTDTGGRFRFPDVKPGKYAIFATGDGYVQDVPDFTLAPPPESSISVGEDKAVKDVALRLTPFGAISGRVVDESGEPIVGATVELLHYTYSRYRKDVRAEQSAVTNDRGEYRLFDVAPGRWYLEVSKYFRLPPLTGRIHSSVVEEGYAATYYPEAVQVSPAADLRGTDFHLRRGRVFHARGTTAPGTEIWAYRCSDDRGPFTAVKVGPSGQFDFKGLSPGCYWLYGELAGPPKIVSQARQVTVADRDLEDLAMRVDPALSITGTVLVEEGSLDQLRVAAIVLEPARRFGTQATAPIAVDGTFTIPNVAPSSYHVLIERAPKLYMKSARFGSVDISADGVLDATSGGGPLNLVLRGDTGQLTGTARPAPTWLPMRITIAPESGRIDLLRTFEPYDSGGGFHADGLAPGDYKVFAWQTADEALVDSAEFRALLESKATHITISAGAKTSVEVQTVTAAEIAEARGRLR